MPAAVKRRKVSATTAKSILPSAGTKPSTISSFARVTKAGSSLPEPSTKKTCFDAIEILPQNLSSSNSKKRRSEDDEDDEGAAANHAAEVLEVAEHGYITPRRNDTRKKPSEHITRTPRGSARNIESLETPTKGARRLLDRLLFSTQTPTPPPPSSTPKSLDYQGSKSSKQLPNELIDLINLHAAFLTALSLHYAHNGTASPADLRLLCPDVARAWGKRGVTTQDIQRTLGVLNTHLVERFGSQRASRLSLSDYGHRKICIEIEAASGLVGRLGRPINEDLLNEIFVHSLSKAWAEKPAQMDCQQFVDSLPREPIAICPSVTKMSPLLMKGQQRLEDLKLGILARTESTKENATETTVKLKVSLLERLRAKQVLNSALPTPPSATEISRRNALQKMEEVAAVLTIISTSSSIGQQRISFTLPTVLGKLKDSLKTPMSKKESECCVRILAEEIAPGWVRLAKMGKVEALVFDRDGKPSAAELRERILKCGGKVSILS